MDELKVNILNIFKKAAMGEYITLLGDCQKWNEMRQDVEKAIDNHLISRSSGSRAAGTVPFGEACHKTLCSECSQRQCGFNPPLSGVLKGD